MAYYGIILNSTRSTGAATKYTNHSTTHAHTSQAGFAGYSSLGNARAGKLKALATTGSTRGAATPDIPTFGEAGYPEVNLVGWFGLLAPVGTPKEIVTRLNTEIVRALRTREIKEKLGGQGIEVIASTPEQFAKVITTEIPVYGRLVKEAKVKIE